VRTSCNVSPLWVIVFRALGDIQMSDWRLRAEPELGRELRPRRVAGVRRTRVAQSSR